MISRTTRNLGYCYAQLSRVTAGVTDRVMKVRIQTGSVPAANTPNSNTDSDANYKSRDIGLTVSYRITGQGIGAVPLAVTVTISLKVVEDDTDLAGGNTGSLGYVAAFSGSVTLPAGGTDPDTAIAGATGTITIPASVFAKAGTFKIIPVVTDVAPSPPSSSDAGPTTYYADGDGYSSFGAAASFNTLVENAAAAVRTGTTAQSIGVDKDPERRGDVVTMSADIADGHSLVNRKNFRLGVVLSGAALTALPLKQASVTPSAVGAASATYTVDSTFPTQFLDYVLRAYLGPTPGGTPTAEKSDFWNAGVGTAFVGSDTAWTYFAALPPTATFGHPSNQIIESAAFRASGENSRRALGCLSGVSGGVSYYGVELAKIGGGSNPSTELPHVVSVKVAPGCRVGEGEAVLYTETDGSGMLCVRSVYEIPWGTTVDYGQGSTTFPAFGSITAANAFINLHFVGIAKTGGGEGDVIAVYVSPYYVFEMNAVSATVEIGDTFGFDSAGGTLVHSYRLAQRIKTQSVFSAVRRETAATTRVLVRLHSAVWGHASSARL